MGDYRDFLTDREYPRQIRELKERVSKLQILRGKDSEKNIKKIKKIKADRDAIYTLLSAVLNDHDYCTADEHECPVNMDCGSKGCIEYLKGRQAVKKTSKEWNEILVKPKGMKIYDPDGWDRSNFKYSWEEELITEEEFNKRLIMSTIIMEES